jgi:hypothetical protein
MMLLLLPMILNDYWLVGSSIVSLKFLDAIATIWSLQPSVPTRTTIGIPTPRLDISSINKFDRGKKWNCHPRKQADREKDQSIYYTAGEF